MMGEDIESVNGEIRYIALELMKIAAQKKMSFDEVAHEFLRNTTLLQKMIEASEGNEQLPRFMQPAPPSIPHAPKMPRPPKVKPGTQ